MPLTIFGALTGNLLMILHHHNKDRHGDDNRSDLILGSKIEGPGENELGHGHPENREVITKNGFSKTGRKRLRDSF